MIRKAHRTLNQNGAALIFTFIIMVTLIIISSAYVFLITYDTRNLGGQKNNVLAFYLAEAGLNKAIWYLLNTAPDDSTDGSWRTTAYPGTPGAGANDPKSEALGEGTYTMWVETSGTNILITARGTVNGIERIITQVFDYTPGEGVSEVFTYSVYSGGNIDFSGSKGIAQVLGDIGAQGNIDQGTVPILGDVDENASVTIPTVDYSEYENIATTVVNGNHVFAANSSYVGMWYVKGDVEIKQNVTITGTVVAEGNISFTGNNIIVTAVPPYPALIAQGNIVGGSGNNLTITGVVYSEGNFEFNDCNNFVFSGNLIVGGDIQLASANNFNITFVANDPPYFSGGGSGGDPSINSISNSWGEI